MLTPVDLKTIASLQTYYPREVIFYSLIEGIDLKLQSSPPQYASLVNDPSEAYYDIDDPYNLDRTQCDKIINGNDNFEVLFHRNPRKGLCSYAKFLNLLSLLFEYGLDTELVQIPAQQPAQVQANQSNIVTVGRFCFDKFLIPGELIRNADFPPCGLDRKQPAGGTIVTAETETHKADDVVINTKTKSDTKTITTTKTSVLPITGHSFSFTFEGVGRVEITFRVRSPNGFLSYLGSWYNARNKIAFERYDRKKAKRVAYYDSISAQQIFDNGPYLSIVNINGPSAECYSSVNYEGQTYCVPLGATHTSMLMDIAIMLRNLNISPSDLNAPVSVRVTD
jgi:hypothetical protein